MDHEFAKRMDNWRLTVTLSGRGGYCCASWAELYIKSRSQEGNGNDLAPPRMFVSINELDGWLVEAAVRSLAIFNEQMVLRYWYVKQYPEHWIKTKLMLRASAVRLVLARAENNLQRVLDKFDSPANILSNKLHAGIDPRPESDANIGVLGFGKKRMALIE